MKCWWGHRTGMNLGGHSEEEIEELTGCIPLLLNECVLNGGIDLSPLNIVANKALTFTDDIRMETKCAGNQAHWDMYVHFIQFSMMELTVF